MINRIVRMSFQEEKVQEFLDWFNTHKEKIKNVEGCLHLELWQDVHQPNVFYTYSIWKEEAAIENYRQSELFQTVWAYTKQLFNDKPQAFSARSHTLLP